MTRLTVLSGMVLAVIGVSFFIDIGLEADQFESVDYFLDILISLDGWLPSVTIFDCLVFLVTVVLGIATYAIFKFAVGD